MINNFVKVFDDIQKNKKKMANSTDGAGFEETLRRTFRSNGFDGVSLENDDVLKKYIDLIKPKVLDVLGTEIMSNELAEKGREYTNIFVHQPYGSQQFPDFLVFTENKIFAIESKYSKKDGKKPTWNSNLPKSNTIYIFGCYEKKDITFFIGEDVLPHSERVVLNNFFEETTSKVINDFKDELKHKFETKEMKFANGFNVYIRKAFEQNRVINETAELNYFSSENRNACEENVKKFILDTVKSDVA